MRYRILGRTGLRVSQVGAGCWAIGGPFTNLGVDGGWSPVSDESAKGGLMKALNLGVNIFDTADVYGLGRSERLVGWLINACEGKGLSRRDLVIVSKTGLFPGCAAHGYDPLHMRHQLEMSLQNLGTEYIDIYFLHHLDFGPRGEYLEGAVRTVRDFQSQGFIRFVGLRGPHEYSFYRDTAAGFDADFNAFCRLATVIDPDVITFRYNMLSAVYDRPDSDLFAWANERRIGMLTYKPLAQGLLLGCYSPEAPPTFGRGDNRRRKRWFREDGLRVIERRLAAVKEHFGVESTSQLARLCVRYCLARDESVCVLIGFEDAQHVAESFSVDEPLGQTDAQFLRRAFAGLSDEIGGFAEDYFKDKSE